jgi:CRISPR-associated endonuclease/helicase Cas3
MLISQCNKNALAETRRILDQFAERRGERTWQTAITQQGLTTLHKLLRKTARKNTAVACHWIRGKDHSEMIWIVGDARRFNMQGATPTNTTERDILRRGDENDWHSAEEIRLLASIAGLFHDFGKANLAFQKKLTSRKPMADAYRHEWISLRLFQAFVGTDSDERWLQRLADGSVKDRLDWKNKLQSDGSGRPLPSPFKTLPPLAQAVGWLIVSHHRLPSQMMDAPVVLPALKHLPLSIEAHWCGVRPDADEKAIKACWTFSKGLPFNSQHWCEHAARIARALQRYFGLQGDDDGAARLAGWQCDAYRLHLSRLALMLADHYYSSLPSHALYGDKDYSLIANTDRETGAPKQRLDEHLIGVEVNAGRIVRALPRMAGQLPRIARHKGFRQRCEIATFRWQDRAFDLAESLQERSAEQGFFGINMASTGCGKTLANGRIMYALANQQQGARFCIALGLRTLTLQTGDAYRERLGLGAEDLAVLVGGGGARQLHERQQAESVLAGHGSESSSDLLPDNHYVHFDGSLEDGPLNRWLGTNRDAQKLLNAPILACTIDHLMPACESTRGGHQIAPMLRLMSSDLVLDEPDDFGIEDLPALTRLVHWAGLLGSRVLLSSATLPPALVQGLFHAYLEGRRIYQQNRGVPGQALNVPCAWFDEFGASASDHAEGQDFLRLHRAFVEKRLNHLGREKARRRAFVQPLVIAPGQSRQQLCTQFALLLQQQVQALHSHNHEVDPVSGKRVSFGLIRMANIDPLVQVAQALCELGAPEGSRIHLCVYHSQHPLLVRSGIERRLDSLLNRKKPMALFDDTELRQVLDENPEQDQIFVVLATAVAEVGRDHDYGWGIVEPSSMRSIIQLAGRIRRHRPEVWDLPNLCVLDTNIRHLEQGLTKPAFCRPGFESKEFPLESHQLSELLTPEQISIIDAASRIRERDELYPRSNLVDLEHARLNDLMLGATGAARQTALPVTACWTTQAMLSGELQRKQRFRDDPLGRQRFGLLPDDEGVIGFYRFDDGRPILDGTRLQPMMLQLGDRVALWGEPHYEEALESLCERLGLETLDCARRFGIVDLPGKDGKEEWSYHPALGFSRFRQNR